MSVNTVNASTEYICQDTVFTIRFREKFIILKCVKSWNLRLLSSFDKEINVGNIISTSFSEDKWKVDQNEEPLLNYNILNHFTAKLSDCFALTINYWEKMENHRRKLRAITLKTSNEKDCLAWQTKINHELGKVLEENPHPRPRNLLVFVNPYCGAKKARSIHEQIAAPLFKLAGIKERVIFTQYAGHAQEYVESQDLSEYDGIVVISGDGTFNEVANGLLIAEQRKCGIALDGNKAVLKEAVKYAKAPIRVGTIPAGSGNIITCTSIGSVDPETSTLHIICGESHPLNVSSVYDNLGRFLKFTFVVDSYGTTSAFVQLTDKLRFFGPFRYTIGAYIGFLKLKKYGTEILYLPSAQEHSLEVCVEESKCKYPCKVCLGQFLKGKPENEPLLSKDFLSTPEYWKIFRGQIFGVNFFKNAMKYWQTPKGFSPSAHLADGDGTMVINCASSRRELLTAVRSTTGREHPIGLPIFEAHRIKGIHLRPLSEKEFRRSPDLVSSFKEFSENDDALVAEEERSFWYHDGEKLDRGLGKTRNGRITIWMHRGILDIFARGIEED